MKFNFKKVVAVATSALMVGMSMGVAAAAQTYPDPFVKAGVADVAIVYGSSGNWALDMVPVSLIQSNLQSKMSTSDGSTTVTGGNAWEVGTSSDKLELGESIRDVETYIGDDDLALLTNGALSNEKGEAKYEQFFYFEDAMSSTVNYTQDDDENQALFFNIKSGKVIARYVMDFTSNLKSDIETDKELSDIEDKKITFLGKTYTIVTADNGTSGVELTLMSGALGGTINNDETLALGDYSITAVVSSATETKFTVTKGSVTETTDKMAKGGMEKLSDGNYLAVTDITYESYAGGIHAATFYIGADKIEWKNGTAMTVNAETINEANVIITHTEASSDISISEISINMTAEDDLFVPEKGKLSEAADLDEPEVLVSQNWDIQFEGLEAVDYEDISLKRNTDLKYVLTWKNYNGEELKLPLLYGNLSGVFGGDDVNERFLLNPNGSLLGDRENITDEDYFLLHTADPQSSTSDAKTILVQYKGADKIRGTTAPTATFAINPGPDKIDKVMSVTQSDGTFTLKYAGGTWNFRNESNGETKDYQIVLVGDDYHSSSGQNHSMSQYIRTQYNTLVNITQQNATLIAMDLADEQPNWYINVSVDDTNRDGDDFAVPQDSQVFAATILNSSATDLSLTFNGITGWLTDPSESTIQRYINRYGASIEATDPADSPAHIEAKVPKSIVRPLVYISTGDISVTTTTGGVTQLGEVLYKDIEINNAKTKNLIVVGGSCVNSAAATLLGGVAYCGEGFTTKTGIGTGEWLIQSFGDAYTTGKIALLVAGYEAADTANAGTYLRTQAVDTTAGNKYEGSSATIATLVAPAASA